MKRSDEFHAEAAVASYLHFAALAQRPGGPRISAGAGEPPDPPCLSLKAVAFRASTSCSGTAPTDVEGMGMMTEPGLHNGEFL
jgi:hypothetical protein